MLTFIEVMVGFIFARALWQYVSHRSRACGQLAIVWLLETTGLLIALGACFVPFVVVGLYFLTRMGK
jgi:hypothetical protein